MTQTDKGSAHSRRDQFRLKYPVFLIPHCKQFVSDIICQDIIHISLSLSYLCLTALTDVFPGKERQVSLPPLNFHFPGFLAFHSVYGKIKKIEYKYRHQVAGIEIPVRGKSGENPARTGHCICLAAYNMPLRSAGEGVQGDEA